MEGTKGVTGRKRSVESKQYRRVWKTRKERISKRRNEERKKKTRRN